MSVPKRTNLLGGGEAAKRERKGDLISIPHQMSHKFAISEERDDRESAETGWATDHCGPRLADEYRNLLAIRAQTSKSDVKALASKAVFRDIKQRRADTRRAIIFA